MHLRRESSPRQSVQGLVRHHALTVDCCLSKAKACRTHLAIHVRHVRAIDPRVLGRAICHWPARRLGETSARPRAFAQQPLSDEVCQLFRRGQTCPSAGACCGLLLSRAAARKLLLLHLLCHLLLATRPKQQRPLRAVGSFFVSSTTSSDGATVCRHATPHSWRRAVAGAYTRWLGRWWGRGC